MDYLITNDDAEDLHYEKAWNPSDWIACCKEYHNIPLIVSDLYYSFPYRCTSMNSGGISNHPHSAASLGTVRFEHLPANSFLALLPKDDTIKVFHNHVEIGLRAYQIFQGLMDEREVLAKAVASLNAVRRKGKAHIHIPELAEEDSVND